MDKFLATITALGGSGLYVIDVVTRTDPGFGGGLPAPIDPGFGRPGGGWEPTDPGFGHRPPPPDPGYGHGHPRPDRPGNALPVPPVRPEHPITLPPGVWPPSLPPGANVPDHGLPPEQPVFIPPDPDLGIEQPIYLPQLPAGVALLIALPQAAPKGDAPANTKPAILVQSGKKPVLVYVSAAASPK
jgi:hypothetical protein